MKRHLILAALAALCFSSCEKLSVPSTDDSSAEETTTDKATRSILFVIKGLDIDYSTRSTLASESITDLYIFEGSTLLKHQVSTDEDFGTPSVSLKIGAHDLTFIASKADGQTWAEGIWSCTKVKDTYGTVLSYTVSASSTSKQVQLTRVNGKVMWTIEDEMRSDASTLTATVEQCFGLDADLNGVSGNTYSASFSLAAYIGKTGATAGINVLPADHTNGTEIQASIAIRNASNTILCQYDNNCTVKANEICNIHGTFFTTGTPTAEVSLLTDWGTTTNYDIVNE